MRVTEAKSDNLAWRPLNVEQVHFGANKMYTQTSAIWRNDIPHQKSWPYLWLAGWPAGPPRVGSSRSRLRARHAPARTEIWKLADEKLRIKFAWPYMIGAGVVKDRAPSGSA